MAVLALSRQLSFHARGDAVFVWHGLTGDVAEMSRDVLALLLAYDPAADEAAVAKSPPAGLGKEQLEEFTTILRSRRFLVPTGIAGRHVDEISPLLAGIPRVPRATVFLRQGSASEPRITIYTRKGPLELDPVTARLFDRCDGERTLGQVLADAGPAALPPLLRLARADVAALKILAKPASQGGVQLNPAAESTMPYPELPDARAFAAGGPAPAMPAEDEASFASLFSAPHPSLRNRSFAEALGASLRERGAFESVRGRKPRAVELVSGHESLGAPLQKALGDEVELTAQPAVQGLAQAAPDSLDAIVASEVAIGLGSEPQDGRVVNQGALRLVREAARALAPGGVLFLSDFGDPKADPAPTAGGFSIRFADLQAEATKLGLGARVLPLAEVIQLDLQEQALSTTRASFPALRALFAAHGLELTRRAWLRSELEKLCDGKLDLRQVHGLQWAPLSERTLGLSPRQFWALVATKPARVLH